MRDLFIYVDESGNTYADLLNVNQPFYTMVALLSESDLQEKRDVVEALRRRHTIKTPELHGLSLFRTRSSGAYREVLTLIEDSSISPMVVVIDKFFITAAKIVDTFFDPHDNPQVPWALYWNRSSRLAMVELIGLSLNEEAVKSFLDGILHENREALASTASMLRSRIGITLKMHLLRNIVSKALSYVETHYDDFTIVDATAAAGYNSPNFIAFTELLFFLSRRLKRTPARRVQLYHDEQRQFQTLFRSTYDVFTRSGECEINFGGDNGDDNKAVLPLFPFKVFSFVNSTSSVGIQLADCLGYALNRLLTRQPNAKMDRASAEIFEAVRGLIKRDLDMIRLFCFEDFSLDLTRWLLRTGKH
jgi:hypothetical protein